MNLLSTELARLETRDSSQFDQISKHIKYVFLASKESMCDT